MRRWHRPPLWTRLLALVLAGVPFAVLWLQPGPHKPVPAAAAAIEVRIPSRVARVDPASVFRR